MSVPTAQQAATPTPNEIERAVSREPGGPLFDGRFYIYLLAAALAIAALSLLLPARATERTAPTWSWGAPTAVMLVLLFILRGWFIH